MVKHTFNYLALLICLAALLTSCLKNGLDKDLPAFTDSKITEIFFEYRYEDPTTQSPDGSNVVRVITLPVSSKQIKLRGTTGAVTDSVIAVVAVPATGFTPASEREKVSATNLVCKTNISTAASVAPLGNSPRMGTPGNFSQPTQYKVTAADGKTESIWTIRIVLVK